MKKTFIKIWQIWWVHGLIYFLLGMITALIFTKTAFTPEDNVIKDIPADPVSKSRG